MTTPVETHARKRLEVIVEQMYLGRVVEILDGRGAMGYTIMPTLAGKGTRGQWTPDPSKPVGSRVVIIAVAQDSAIEGIMGGLRDLFTEIPGVAFVSDTVVLRRDR